MTAPGTLSIGQRIGAYVIQRVLGSGGMGEVFLARDMKLGRDVAIKVLRASFTADSERVQRFEREARLLASLSHPNIAAIYGVEESTMSPALVLEFVDGPTLAERITLGPIPQHDCVGFAIQICEAIEAAHRQGIIHRDLKPANIKLRSDGCIKVLDFGLSKALDAPTTQANQLAETLTSPAMTRTGVILGTAAYMSPEQARGYAADKQSDIFAFGCVLYEMLTGKRAFEGASVSDTLAAVLRAEVDMAALPPSTSPALQRLVRRCLEKDRRRRVHDIGDVRLELEELSQHASAVRPAMAIAATARPKRWLALAVAGITLTIAAAVALIRAPSRTASGVAAERVSVLLKSGVETLSGEATAMAVSPNGRTIVYVGRIKTRPQLLLRSLDRYDEVPLAGTEGASAPFFSPDGRWVGFFAGDSLQRVSVIGGAPLKICDAPAVVAASWAEDGTIVFSTVLAGDGLWRVPMAGGEAQSLTRPKPEQREARHTFPQQLPGRAQLLFTVQTDAGTAYPALLSLRNGQWTSYPQVRIAVGGARWLPTGHLVYASDGGLVAVPFDPERGGATDPPITIPEQLAASVERGAQYAISGDGDGALVYLPRVAPDSGTLVIVEASGRREIVAAPAGAGLAHPRFSPDGQKLVVDVEGEQGSDVWVYDVQRGTRTRLTSNGLSGFPVWSPDGRQVAFHADRIGPWTLYGRSADASAKTVPLLTADRPPSLHAGLDPDRLLPGYVPALSGAFPQYPMSWTRGGRVLAFTERKPGAERDIWLLQADDPPVPFLVTPADEFSPSFSPDGQFIAYVSDETGQNEVYVQPYPEPGARWTVSANGGEDPVWLRDGHRLVYRHGQDLLMAVKTDTGFDPAAPAPLLPGQRLAISVERNYDVSPDGRRFAIIESTGTVVPQLRMVRHWFTEIRLARQRP